MKYLMIVMVLIMSGCATTQMEKKRAKVLDCTKDSINMASGTIDSYKVCKDLFTRENK